MSRQLYGSALEAAITRTVVSGANEGNFTAIAGAGVTKTTDSDVLYDGQATTRVDVPATLSGFFEIGMAAATSTFDAWGAATPQPGQMGLVYMTDRPERITAFTLFLGDATFTAYGTSSWSGVSNFLPLAMQWATGYNVQQAWSLTGAPTWTGARRWKVRVNVSAGEAMRFWVAKLSQVSRERAAFCLTSDDGYDEHYSYLYPACVSRGVPQSLAISRDLVASSAAFVTEAQLIEMQNDPSGLVELVNHCLGNDSLNDIGLSAYLDAVEQCREYLDQLGSPIGARQHVYVQGVNSPALITELIARGYESARRASTQNFTSYKRQRFYANPREKLNIPISFSLDSGTSLAQAKAKIDQCILEGGVCVAMGHRYEAAAGVLTWATGDMDQLLDYVVQKSREGSLDMIKLSDIPRRFVNYNRAIA